MKYLFIIWHVWLSIVLSSPPPPLCLMGFFKLLRNTQLIQNCSVNYKRSNAMQAYTVTSCWYHLRHFTWKWRFGVDHPVEFRWCRRVWDAAGRKCGHSQGQLTPGWPQLTHWEGPHWTVVTPCQTRPVGCSMFLYFLAFCLTSNSVSSVFSPFFCYFSVSPLLEWLNQSSISTR